jgi:oligopeptidase B
MHPHTPHTQTYHGHALIDDYAWLRAENWQEVLRNPSALPHAIREHLERENNYCHAMLADMETLQSTLAQELRSRLPTEDAVVWASDGPFEYGQQQARDDAHPRLVRRAVSDGAVSVMVDLAAEAKGRAFFRAGYSMHSPTHRTLAWFVDDVGSERFTILFRDLQTGRDLVGRVRDAAIGGAFSKDGRCYIYVGLDSSNRKNRLYLHRIGDMTSKDTLLLEERDPRFSLNVRLTQSRDWFVVVAQSHEQTEVRLIPAHDPLSPAVLVTSRHSPGKYHVDEGGGLVYGMTNADSAADYKIVVANVDGGQLSPWRELVPHRPGTTIVGHRVFQRHLVWLERRDGVLRAKVRRHSDGDIRAVPLGQGSCALDLGVTHAFDTDALRLVYSSMRTPMTVFDVDMNSGALTRVSAQTIDGAFDEANYVTRQIQATADDGSTVPVSLIFHRNTALDSTAPCLLFGYGAYGVSIPAHFDAHRLSLVDRGFIYAIAHVRGGGERGVAWHAAGKGANKLVGVRDFIAAARALVEQGYAGIDRIVAHGVSAGGALLGAAMNEAPDVFAAVIAEAPFVDVLNTMLDASLPLTALEWPEWGNPAVSKEAFEQIASWSPYENVKVQAYPPVLAVQALTDPRVTYWEPAKWTARLRERQTRDAPILLSTRIDAGHTGSASRLDRIADTALLYAFAIKVTGLATA